MRKAICSALKRYFKDNKIRYAEIEEKMCVSNATVVNWLKHGKVSLDTLDALCTMFEIDKIEILLNEPKA